jgi:DMSO reductase anchor subunit
MSDTPVPDAPNAKPVSTWRKVLAAIFDFITIFFAGGYAVGYLTGSLTPDGFELQGGPALLLLAVIVAYIVVFSKYLGGTLWQRILKAR